MLTQNDTYMVLFTQTPIYLGVMIIISSVYLNENKKFIDELPEEYRQQAISVSFTKENNINVMILSAFTPVIVNYLQQVDVSLILIKKWLI